jgi:F420-0:gamma-glutamyl ligase-like protein
VHFTRIGDEWLASRSERAAAALAQFTAHEQRALFARSSVDGRDYARAPIRTRLFESGDVLADGLVDALRDVILQPGDLVAVSEKAVAICQGRSYPVGEVRARPLARVLSRFVGRTASGIGLGIPATMELAIREAGAPRILGATAAAAVTKPFGVKGVFYRVAGPAVRAIDGPTRGTIPPYDGHAKMGPEDPEGVARELAAALGVGVAVIDANDIGVNVLGVSDGIDPALVESLLRDNPLGQGAQQTPVALLRPV